MKRTAAFLATLALAGTARAHLLECVKTVNGTQYYEVSSYPDRLTYRIRVKNLLADQISKIKQASDPLLETLGWEYEYKGWYEVPPGGYVDLSPYDVYLDDEKDCLYLAALDGKADRKIENTFIVGFDHKGEWTERTCSAVVYCGKEGKATRTPGFYKTHERALESCLSDGPITLGSIRVDSLEEALGLLWGSPAKFAGGSKRSDFDQSWYLLARHTLVAICNQRNFGTPTSPRSLIRDALAALSGDDCEKMGRLQDALDAYNNGGDKEPFPDGFDPGPATPQHASAIADDPTGPTSGRCR
jgi:hypothetical protein